MGRSGNTAAKRRARIEEIVEDFFIKCGEKSESELKVERIVIEGIGLAFRVRGRIVPSVLAYWIDTELRRMKYRRM